MKIWFFIINEKIENTKISSMLPYYVFFHFRCASVNTIFTTVAKIILFKFILTKSVLQISFIGLW